MDPVFVALVEYLQYQRNILDHTYVSAFSILIYDYALTLHLEIKYIWFSRWSYTKVLFLLIRYITFVTMIIDIYVHLPLNFSGEVCKISFPLSLWLILFRNIFAEIILCIRTWAIWNRHNVVGAVLAIAMLASAALWSFLTYHFTHSLQFALPPYLGFEGCFISGTTRIFLAAQYVIWLAIEILTLILVVVSAFRFYRAGRNGELSFIIHRDGILFYLYLLLLTVANMIIAIAAPLDLITIFNPLANVLYSVFTTRIVLNIRSVANQGQQLELHTSYFETRARLTPLRFGPLEHLPDRSVSANGLKHGNRNAKDSPTGYQGAGTI